MKTQPGPDTQSIKKALLAASDWTQLPDVPLTEEQKAAWSAYRQAVRDVVNLPYAEFPDPPVFPAE